MAAIKQNDAVFGVEPFGKFERSATDQLERHFRKGSADTKFLGQQAAPLMWLAGTATVPASRADCNADTVVRGEWARYDRTAFVSELTGGRVSDEHLIL